MQKIGIIGAMQIEIDLLSQNMSEKEVTTVCKMEFIEGKLHDKAVVIVRSGVGKVNAALCANILILQFGATKILNTGIAGAMAKGLGVLDIVISTDALYYDMDATGFGYMPTQIPQMQVSDFTADKNMQEVAKEVFPILPQMKGHRLVLGRIATGDKFVSKKELKQQIDDICSPCCVEMEGAAIAHACYLSDVPFLIIRCMSDMASDGEEATYKFNDKIAADMGAALVEALIQKL